MVMFRGRIEDMRFESRHDRLLEEMSVVCGQWSLGGMLTPEIPDVSCRVGPRSISVVQEAAVLFTAPEASISSTVGASVQKREVWWMQRQSKSRT